MALVRCPECGHAVSEAASVCPNCGCPMYSQPAGSDGAPAQEPAYRPEEPKKGNAGKIVALLIVLALLIAGIVFVISMQKNTFEPAQSEQTTEQQENNDEGNQTEDQQNTPDQQTDNQTDQGSTEEEPLYEPGEDGGTDDGGAEGGMDVTNDNP